MLGLPAAVIPVVTGLRPMMSIVLPACLPVCPSVCPSFCLSVFRMLASSSSSSSSSSYIDPQPACLAPSSQMARLRLPISTVLLIA